ncbi:MAG: hypothetical protein HYT71_00685 [Candidatus Aenigmarchaeota archaeon]|nr:hypothetical protein [Candidatus Aenigmarchaeota archaeon]
MAKILNFALSWALSLAVLSAGATAAVTVNDLIFDTTTADAGTTRTVSVTMSTDSGSATINSFSISSSPSGLTVSSVDTPFTVGTSGTSKTFTISSSTSETYTFSVTAIDSNGASSSSNSATVEYVTPSSLTMDVLENPLSTVYEGNNTGISINVINNLGSSQTRNLTLYQNLSNTFVVNTSLGSDPATQTLSLSSGQTRSVVWNITIGSFTGTGHSLVRLGDTTEAKVFTLTKGTTTTVSTATTTTAGGVGGSGATTTTTTTTTTTISGQPGHEIQNIVREIIQRNNEEIKSLIDSKEELQTGLRIALGKELSAEIKAAVSATTEKIQKNVASNRSIDIDTVNSRSSVSLKIKYNGTEQVNNFLVKDVIPKSFADSSSKITVSAPGAVVNVTKADPEYIFTYKNITPGEEKTISYSVNERAFTVSGEYSAPVILAESTQVYVPPTTQTNQTTTTLSAAEKINLTFVLAVVLILGGIVWYYYQNHGKKQPWQSTIKSPQLK